MNMHEKFSFSVFGFSIPVFIVLTVFLLPSVSNAIPLLQGKTTNLMAAHETSAESLKFIAEQEGFSPGTEFSTVGQFGSDNWNFSINGTANNKNLSLNFAGGLTGDFGSDIKVDFTGTGSYGTTPFSSNGKLTLFFDNVLGDYYNAHYDDEMTYGSSTVSRTVRGAELVGGAIVGGYIGGWWGAFTGAMAAWFLSDVVDQVVIGPTPPPPPVRPPPPATPPQTVPPLTPTINNNGEFSGAVFQGDNITINKNRGNFIHSSGTLNTQNGEFNGTTSIPEPAAFWLLLTGLGILGVGARRRKNSQS